MTLCFHEKLSSPYPCWTSDPPYYLLSVPSFDFLPNSNPNALTFQVKNAEESWQLCRSCAVCPCNRLLWFSARRARQHNDFWWVAISNQYEAPVRAENRGIGQGRLRHTRSEYSI